MDVTISINKCQLDFKTPGGTSRGILKVKKLWILCYETNGKKGFGECSVIDGLTPEYKSDDDYEVLLLSICHRIEKQRILPKVLLEKLTDLFPELMSLPSIRFGIETALLDYLKKQNTLFVNQFTMGFKSIPINGLVWMGDVESMKKQALDKISEGFKVIKFKIGALDWEQEKKLISEIRKDFPREFLAIRVDANGCFEEDNIREVLYELKCLDVHSIEQPVSTDNQKLLSDLSSENIIPIALDESLISCHSHHDKKELLQKIKPQFIVIKPSLHGGIQGSKEWIELANSFGIGWWVTSALESNIGLNAIAQFVGEYQNELAQGLGTGGLYTNNYDSNLRIESGEMTFVIS